MRFVSAVVLSTVLLAALVLTTPQAVRPASAQSCTTLLTEEDISGTVVPSSSNTYLLGKDLACIVISVCWSPFGSTATIVIHVNGRAAYSQSFVSCASVSSLLDPRMSYSFAIHNPDSFPINYSGYYIIGYYL